MPRGLAIDPEQGRIWLLSGFEAALAEGEASAGEIDAGHRRPADALAELERTEERWYEAEMHRIRADILLKRDPVDTAAAERTGPERQRKAERALEGDSEAARWANVAAGIPSDRVFG